MIRKKKMFEAAFETLLSNLDEEDYRPTNKDLDQLFNLFNHKYFNGELPKCVVFNDHLEGNALGCFYFNPTVVKQRINGVRVIDENVLKNIAICIDNTTAFTKKQLCETLIHEMVHLYQFVEHPSSVFIDGGHESFFQEKANHISAISEFSITVTCDQKLGNRRENDIYSIITSDPILCVLYKNINGRETRFGVASIPYSFIERIASIILSSGKYSKIEFFECKNKNLLKKIDSIFGTNKENAITLAMKVMYNPVLVSTRELTCASWYDVDRFFDFDNDTRYIVGIEKNGKILKKESVQRNGKIITERLDKDIIDLKLDLLQSGDDKLSIEEIERVDDDEYSVMARLV